MKRPFYMINRSLSGKAGAVLLMALTLLAVVFILVLSLNATVGFNLSGNTRFLKQVQAGFLVDAGLEKALWQIKNQTSNDFSLPVFLNQTLSFGEPQGIVNYRIIDEESKFNIYRAEESQLARIAGFDPVSARKLLAMFKEKIPPGYLGLSHNSLREMGLPVPEKINRLSFEIGDFFTIWGDGKININSASQAVLALIPEFTEEIAATIVQFRQEKKEKPKDGERTRVFNSPEDLIRYNLVPLSLYEKISPWVKVDSNFFSVNAVAFLGGVKENQNNTVKAEGTCIIRKDNSEVKVIFKRFNNG